MIDFPAMPSPVVHAVTLVRHPESGGTAIRGIDARVCREESGTLAITYSIEGDLSRLRIPPPRPPRIAHGLWKQTCCECFIAFPGKPGYYELNLAPSGEWAAYAYAKYRERTPFAAERLDPRIAVRNRAEKFELDAFIPLDQLSAKHPRQSLALGLSAVVEDEHGVLSYWALRHPPGRPDFHHPDSFVLELESL